MIECSQTGEEFKKAALQRLESLYNAGVRQIPRSQFVAREAAGTAMPAAATPAHTSAPRPPVASLPSPPSAVVQPKPATPTAPTPMPKPESLPVSPPSAAIPISGPLAERAAALEIINREVRACTLCTELVENRSQTVFGVGNLKPRLCFFGEAPGADEDRVGEPFVGRAGKLLNDIIKACTFQREDVYILNVCKCRPPGNRTPLPDEAANCRHFWERQLAVLQPEYVVCLGACAAQTMLRTTQSVGKLRGRIHDYQGIKVVATYHPAYLLRNPDAKRDVWEDMKMLLRDMGVELPKK